MIQRETRPTLDAYVERQIRRINRHINESVNAQPCRRLYAVQLEAPLEWDHESIRREVQGGLADFGLDFIKVRIDAGPAMELRRLEFEPLPFC